MPQECSRGVEWVEGRLGRVPVPSRQTDGEGKMEEGGSKEENGVVREKSRERQRAKEQKCKIFKRHYICYKDASQY